MSKFTGILPAGPALYAAVALFPPYVHGWGCRPTPGSVALILVWLLPLLGGVRALFARRIERSVVVASWVLAAVAVGLTLEASYVASVTSVACR